MTCRARGCGWFAARPTHERPPRASKWENLAQRCATMADMATDSSDAWIQRHVALGLVVSFASQMEATLRYCFSVLDGGKHAGIVAGGQPVGWLITYSRALADANKELAETTKLAVRDALIACEAANQRRNELVHGLHFWPGSSVGEPSDWGMTLRSRRGQRELAETEWTISEIQDAAWALFEASQLLGEAGDGVAGVRRKGQPDWERW